MICRRELVSAAMVTLLIVPLAACTSSSGGSSSGVSSGCGVFATSTVVMAHSHTLCVPTTDLTNPPAAGATYTTSGPDPTHTVTLTQQQLASIDAGQTVNVTTSVANNHTHDFALMKGANTSPLARLLL